MSIVKSMSDSDSDVSEAMNPLMTIFTGLDPSLGRTRESYVFGSEILRKEKKTHYLRAAKPSYNASLAFAKVEWFSRTFYFLLFSRTLQNEGG